VFSAVTLASTVEVVGAQHPLAVAQQELRSQQLVSLSTQQIVLSQQIGSSSIPKTEIILLRLGPPSAIRDTNPNTPKINNKLFFILILFYDPNNIVCNE
jgi:hypothetical protein